MKSAADILSELLAHTNKTKNSLAKAIGLPRSQNLYDIEKGKIKNISSELSEKIIKAYPEINRNYLLTGKGKMLKENSNELHEPEPPEIVRHGSYEHDTVIRGGKDVDILLQVPLITTPKHRKYADAVASERRIEQFPKFPILPGIKPKGAIWRYFEVGGDEMEPTFRKGDFILATQVSFLDYFESGNFNLYVFVTKDRRILFRRAIVRERRVPLDEDFAWSIPQWIIIAENEEKYPQEILDGDDVLEVWLHRRSILNWSPKPAKQIEIKVK
ncbi:hypothetical protein [Segetibacter aerophilus]|uniref:HTH cro/C1-type domain-containing protein n=1 Tax=Segetibacter aerophilus TaxID=670293 RepID=A0A512B9T4_9BACT|nr:hypothetical protein [Segetibacter aerophilus]GEO08712.1 hypothetical protein SAE01_12080 [Segetibacter aerophilus]